MPQVIEEESLNLESSLKQTEEYNEPVISDVVDIAFDPKVKYSSEYYENYIVKFEPNSKKRYLYCFIKRFFDIVMSFFGLIILLPFFVAIAIAIKIDSKGPIMFKQKRVGKNGKVFSCLKFRSMKIDAPKDCATSLLINPGMYYTRVGRFIRKFSIDELPQLWCVLIGKMSFIGYRPLVLTEEKCNEMRSRLGVFSMRPGISGYAQVHGRDDVYYKNKAILDATYVKKANLWLDIKLVFQTVLVVLKRNGNHTTKANQHELYVFHL